jgi:hypothetical protein
MRKEKFMCSPLAVSALVVVLLSVLFLASSSINAQTVVSRARIGGYSEDIAYVASGPLKDNIVMLNGFAAYAAPVDKKNKGKEPLVKLFDLKFPEFNVFVNGITYVESEGLFFVNQSDQPTKLFLVDQTGALKETRKIQYLDSSYRPVQLEGLAYIPQSSPIFPDHLIMVVLDNFGDLCRFEIMRRDGVVVQEIARPDWPDSFLGGLVGDVAFLAPNKLLVTTYEEGIWTMDFQGNILSGPVAFGPGTIGVGEGIVQIGDGRVVAVTFPQNLIYFDSSLNRDPSADRNDVFGQNVNLPTGIAWNSDTGQLLISHDFVLSSNPNAGVAAVPTTLNSATPFINLSSFSTPNGGMTYLPAEHLTAVANINPGPARAILLFNADGTFNSQISLSPATLGQNLGRPLAITFIPATNEFVVAFDGNGTPVPVQQAERQRLRVFSRSGTLVRTIDLTATGNAGVAGLSYFNDPNGGGGRFIILGTAGRVFVTDLNGNARNPNGTLIQEFNIRVKLGLLLRNDITAITSGPLAGAFAVLDRSGSEVVIFRLD